MSSSLSRPLALGIDAGGTYTDAVLLEGVGALARWHVGTDFAGMFSCQNFKMGTPVVPMLVPANLPALSNP